MYIFVIRLYIEYFETFNISDFIGQYTFDIISKSTRKPFSGISYDDGQTVPIDVRF